MISMKGCGCNDWFRSYKQIIMVFLKADELGINYTGSIDIKFCPFCGSSLEDMSKFQGGKNLFFDHMGSK